MQLITLPREFTNGEISNKAGLDILENEYFMNRNSASDYIHNFNCMVEGRRFSRTSNAYGTEYYLEQMYKDGGRPLLLNALKALGEHLDYYEAIGNTGVPTGRAIYDRFAEIAEIEPEQFYPDEVASDESFLEGKGKKIFVNAYERNPIARQQCVEHYGYVCVICGFDFERVYGPLGREFIHVHHLVELASIGAEYSVSPIKDLRPVCPNCHAMIHRKKPALTIEEIKDCLASHSDPNLHT